MLMNKISISLKFFVNSASRPVVLMYQMQFCDLNYFLNKFLGYCLGCRNKGNSKTYGTDLFIHEYELMLCLHVFRQTGPLF